MLSETVCFWNNSEMVTFIVHMHILPISRETNSTKFQSGCHVHNHMVGGFPYTQDLFLLKLKS